MTDKFKTSPRSIAAVIAKQKTKEARAQMLMQAPAEWQPLIKTHVALMFERKKFEKNGR